MSDTPKVQVDTKETTDTAEPKKSYKGLMSWFRESFPNKPYTVLGAAIGLIVALLIFAIGLIKTLFVVICVALGVAVGQYLDGNPKLITFIKHIISDGRN